MRRTLKPTSQLDQLDDQWLAAPFATFLFQPACPQSQYCFGVVTTGIPKDVALRLTANVITCTVLSTWNACCVYGTAPGVEGEVMEGRSLSGIRQLPVGMHLRLSSSWQPPLDVLFSETRSP